MLTTLLTLQIAEFVPWLLLTHRVKDAARKRTLMGTKTTTLPIIDSKLKQFAGNPTKFQKVCSTRLTSMVRSLVNTKAFEYAITALVNNKSGIHKRFKAPMTVRIP
jgi:hypothetical protein